MLLPSNKNLSVSRTYSKMMGIQFLILALVISATLLGEFWNFNLVIMFLFVVFMLCLFCMDGLFFIKHLYYLINSTLLVTGVLVCDQIKVPLTEIGRTSGFTNAVGYMVIFRMLFFMAAYYCYSYWSQKRSVLNIKRNRNSEMSKYFIPVIIWAFIAMEVLSCLMLSKIGPSYKLGLSRSGYRDTVLPFFVQKVEGYILPMLALLIVSDGKNKKVQNVLFGALSFFILFWVGEKFGSYFLLVSILLIGSNLDGRVIRKKKGVLALITVAIMAALLGLVFVQYLLLFKYTISQFLEYLYSRLAQQGQVWWSVFQQEKNALPNIKLFFDELLGALNPESSLEFPYLGQWKMMEIASKGSNVIRYRISIGLPLTSTTEASSFYYFGFWGIFFTPLLLGIVYALVFTRLEIAIKNKKVLSAFIYTKIYIYITYLTGASDIQSILSWKGILYIFCALIIETCNLDNIKFGLRNRVLKPCLENSREGTGFY